MAETVQGAIRELLEQTMSTIDVLLQASDRELPMPSSHACAQGRDLWTLITNDIDHEKIHTGQVLEARYESRITASPMQRLVAEWLAERMRFIGSLVGLTDEQFNRETAPGQWTYRVVAKHVLALEQDTLKAIAAEHGARATEKPAARMEPVPASMSYGFWSCPTRAVGRLTCALVDEAHRVGYGVSAFRRLLHPKSASGP